MAALRSLLEWLSRPASEVRAENLRAWAGRLPGVTPIAAAEERRHNRVAGVVQNIRIDPREGTGTIEATIFDGTGHMVARWLGRSSLKGIRLGTALVVEGIAGRGEEDEFVVLNPQYEIVTGPEHR
jgi:hypothetical protein